MKPTSPALGEVARAALTRHIGALVEQPDDMEGVHQRRVATRRLRAALRFFRSALPPSADDLRVELAWLAAALGAVRDLDVHIATIHEQACELGVSSDFFAPVIDRLAARRATARAELAVALESPRYATLVHALCKLTDAAWPAASLASAFDAVPPLIEQRVRRLRAAARRARPKAPASVLHRTRIRGKQLRYALEFVADLYGRPARALVKRLTRVQDVLGAIQDAATQTRVLESMRDDVPPACLVLLEHALDQRARAARNDVSDAIAAVLRPKRRKRLHRAFVRQPRHDEAASQPDKDGAEHESGRQRDEQAIAGPRRDNGRDHAQAPGRAELIGGFEQPGREPSA